MAIVKIHIKYTRMRSLSISPGQIGLYKFERHHYDCNQFNDVNKTFSIPYFVSWAPRVQDHSIENYVTYCT